MIWGEMKNLESHLQYTIAEMPSVHRNVALEKGNYKEKNLKLYSALLDQRRNYIPIELHVCLQDIATVTSLDDLMEIQCHPNSLHPLRPLTLISLEGFNSAFSSVI